MIMSCQTCKPNEARGWQVSLLQCVAVCCSVLQCGTCTSNEARERPRSNSPPPFSIFPIIHSVSVTLSTFIFRSLSASKTSLSYCPKDLSLPLRCMLPSTPLATSRTPRLASVQIPMALLLRISDALQVIGPVSVSSDSGCASV